MFYRNIGGVLRYQEELKKYAITGELKLPVLMTMLTGIKKMRNKGDFLHWFRDWYELYRLTSHWRELRKMVFGMCERCNFWEVEVVHHLSYKNLGKETDKDIMGLCNSCHKKVHSGESINFLERVFG